MVADNAAVVLAPAYATPAFLFAMAPAGIAMLIWLLVRGVDLDRWRVSTRSVALGESADAMA